MTSHYVISETISNKGKLDDVRYKVAPIWHESIEANDERLNKIKGSYNNSEAIWHINLAPPICGPVASIKWFNEQFAVGTIHECKIPGEDPRKEEFKNEEEHNQKIEEYKKTCNKSEQTVKYAKTLKAYMISSLTEANYLIGKGVKGVHFIQRIPPNIDPRTIELAEFQDPIHRNNTITHFGMIRGKKGIDEVLEVQRLLQEKKSDITTVLVGRVTAEYFSIFLEILEKIYGLEPLKVALIGSKYQDLLQNEILCLKNELEKVEIERNDQKLNDENNASEAADIVQFLNGKIVNKQLNLEFYPNATDQEIFKLLSTSKIAYLPFERGATFHSGTLPACILSDNALVTTQGDETPQCYKNNLIITQNASAAAGKILDLIETNANLSDQINKQQILKELFPTWANVAKTSFKLIKAAQAQGI